jgi:hypothetical protein
MADFQKPTELHGKRVQYGFYRFFTTSTNPNYVHFKTNASTPSKMIMIEAIGQNFGASQAIRCAWNFYRYSTASVVSTNLYTIYPGLEANGIYLASDNSVVIRAYAPSGLYYAGWTLNAYTTAGAGIGFQVQITDAIQTTESGNYY